MNRTAFYDIVRGAFGPLKQSQVDGIDAILAATEAIGLEHRAYLLATAWHETARTMQPIAEYGKGKGRPYGSPGKYGQAQYGRGYVQLTWDANYAKADKALGLNGALLKDFNLAMQPTIAALILVRGCVEGWFTGKKLGDYATFREMRRVVNGTDKADAIADIAETFKDALIDAQFVTAPIPAPTPPAPVQGFWAALFQALLGIVRGR